MYITMLCPWADLAVWGSQVNKNMKFSAEVECLLEECNKMGHQRLVSIKKKNNNKIFYKLQFLPLFLPFFYLSIFSFLTFLIFLLSSFNSVLFTVFSVFLHIIIIV